jgi:hypothetical protein
MLPEPHAHCRRPRYGARRALTRASLAILLCCGIVGSAVPTASAVEPGVVVPGPTFVHPVELKSLGAHWVRMFVTWPDLEPARGVYAANWWAMYDQAIAVLPPGTKVILDVVDTPRWETGSSDIHTPPANPAEYAALLGKLAKQFAGRVSAYEIWNEEDAPWWWKGAPDPAGYVRLLQATYPAIKAADPNATVVLGGLTGNDFKFVEGVYQAGGKGFFDVVGVHTDTACNILSPYTFLRGPDNKIITDSFLAYREVRAVMLANGDDKPIWMTELSWRTTDATCAEGRWAGTKAGGVSEEQQATYLRQAYHCLSQDPYMQVALWFPMQDEGSVVSGLIRANGSHKPSFDAMRSVATEGDTLTEPCGIFTGPKISVASPGSHIVYQERLPIRVTAASSQGVFRIRLLMDGKLIRNFDDPSYPSSIFGEINWEGARYLSRGPHKLTLLAYDKQRNVSQVDVTVYHQSSHTARKTVRNVTHKVKRKARRTRRHVHRRHR